MSTKKVNASETSPGLRCSWRQGKSLVRTEACPSWETFEITIDSWQYNPELQYRSLVDEKV